MLFFIALLSDRVTKSWAVGTLSSGTVIPVINNVLDFMYLENHGAAFGILQGKQTMFIIITLLVTAAIVSYLVEAPTDKKNLTVNILLSLIAGGAIGNFIDRITLKYVIDFIYFKPINWPVFNVADIYVSLGAVILAILVLFVYKDGDVAFLRDKRKEK